MIGHSPHKPGFLEKPGFFIESFTGNRHVVTLKHTAFSRCLLNSGPRVPMSKLEREV